jgi:hypothetical protein
MRWIATAVLFAVVPLSSLHAQGCPTAQSGKRGFVVERGDNQKSEVHHVGDGVVRTVMRYAGTTLLETTLYEGLFSLERIDRGRRMTRKPKTDLASLFPLKPGRKVVAVFELIEASGRIMPSTVVLSVKGAEQVLIGPCKYPVLKIEHSESRGEHAPRQISIDYYSPDLKLVLMREYQDGGGRSTSIKYDRIYPIK